MQTPLFLILFLAPVYVPLTLLKGWIHAVASVNPATAFLDAGRGLISGVHNHTGLAFACALGADPLALVWTLTRPAQRRSLAVGAASAHARGAERSAGQRLQLAARAPRLRACSTSTLLQRPPSLRTANDSAGTPRRTTKAWSRRMVRAT